MLSHPVRPSGLAARLDYGAHAVELERYSVPQVGIAKQGEPAFRLPSSHRDAARQVAAYYFWLFPTTMFNVYPWGVSVNTVVPLAADRTRVSFLPFVWDQTQREQGAGSGLDRVEREDEAIVEAVQRGVRSRLYDRGRYSPTREAGVHHFHRCWRSSCAADRRRDRGTMLGAGSGPEVCDRNGRHPAAGACYTDTQFGERRQRI